MSGPLTDRSFSSFSELAEDTVAYLSETGFHYATPVQAAVLPLFCGNKDVVVDACTGSGKTLAFLLPVLEKLRSNGRNYAKHDVAFVVISPTRELATQTFGVAQPLFKQLTSLSILRLVGGSEVGMDLKEIQDQGGNAIIATPGRLNDIMKKQTPLNFATVEVLVLDEADRLLDLGFEAQLLEIVHRLPKQRRTGLFSATQTEACEALVKAGLRNPLRINVTTTATATAQRVSDFAQKTPQTLSISAVVVPVDQKWNQFVHFLQHHADEKIIVYGLTCACVEYWFYVLRKTEGLNSLTVRALHGKMPQNAREKAIAAFASDHAGMSLSRTHLGCAVGCLGVLLATDVAARGLDIPEMQWVIQLDAPQDPNGFVHRVGRTARLGRTGSARIYLAPNEESYIKFLQLRKVPIQKEDPEKGVRDEMGWMRTLSETQREAMLKGITAYTSYIRAYSNHHCPYIFSLKELDLGKLAYAYGLLYLPGMKEIKVKGEVDFVASKVDPRQIPFLDKAREAERWKGLQQDDQAMESKTERKREKKRRDRRPSGDQEAAQKLKRTRNPNKRDLDELEADYKNYRLEKRGKIKTLASPQLPPRSSEIQEDTSRDVSQPEPATEMPPKSVPDLKSSAQREALKASLHEKLESLQQLRRGRLNRK